jgi:predicted DNA-binding ribbon-helix-helix protein
MTKTVEVRRIAKHSIVVDGRKTSVSLEWEFWAGVHNIARLKKLTISQLVGGIRDQNPRNLSSAIRVHVLRHTAAPEFLEMPGAVRR